MRSQWIHHKGHQIFWQNFSSFSLLDTDVLRAELHMVQEIVLRQPKHSVLVLADFRNTQIGKDLMDLMVDSSKLTKDCVKKTAVLGIYGTKRVLADALIRFTGQPLTFFDNEEKAKDWLVE
jgi:hypothetical protein